MTTKPNHIIIKILTFNSFLLLTSTFIYSCQETKKECLDRIFHEQVNKQMYYTDRLIDAYDNGDIKQMNLYKDSSTMAYYYSHNVLLEKKR